MAVGCYQKDPMMTAWRGAKLGVKQVAKEWEWG
jgi:hypothetical protein